SGAMRASSSISEAVLRRRVAAVFHGPHVALDRLQWTAGAVHEVADEARLAAGGDIENVVEHQDLAVDVGPRADPDPPHLELARDHGAELGRNAFEQHDVSACGRECLRIADHLPRGLLVATLHAKSADLVH